MFRYLADGIEEFSSLDKRISSYEKKLLRHGKFFEEFWLEGNDYDGNHCDKFREVFSQYIEQNAQDRAKNILKGIFTVHRGVFGWSGDGYRKKKYHEIYSATGSEVDRVVADIKQASEDFLKIVDGIRRRLRENREKRSDEEKREEREFRKKQEEHMDEEKRARKTNFIISLFILGLTALTLYLQQCSGSGAVSGDRVVGVLGI